MKIFALLLNAGCLFYAVNNLQAQSERFAAGYYVTTQQDTVRGFILDRSLISQSNSFFFKSSLDQVDLKEFTPEQVSFFSYEPIYRFRAMKIVREGREETKFLQQLVEGYAELYQDNRLGKPIYVLTKSADENIQLEKNDTIIGQRIKVDRAYIGKMLYLFRDCQQFLRQRPRIEFTQGMLTRVVHQYNKCAHPEVESKILTEVEKFTLEAGCAAGAGILLLHSSEGILNLSETGVGINAGLIVKLTFQKRISFRTGLFYHKFRSEGTREFSFGADFFATEYKALEIPLTLQYQLRGRRITPYFYTGVNLPISQKMTRHFERTEFGAQTINRDRDIDLEGQLLIATLGGGVTIKLSEGTALLFNLEYDYKDQIYSLVQALRPHRFAFSAGIQF